MSEQEMWVPTERVAKIIRDWLEEWEERNPDLVELGYKGLKDYSRLTGLPERRIHQILTGEMWTRKNGKSNKIPYLNMTFDLVDEMFVNMGRVDLWHTELADIYTADSLPKRKHCKECGVIKSTKEMRRLTSAGHADTCIECLDGVAA